METKETDLSKCKGVRCCSEFKSSRIFPALASILQTANAADLTQWNSDFQDPPPLSLARSSFCHATPPRIVNCIGAAKSFPLKSFFFFFFSSVGVQLLWQNTTFYRIWWCLYCKHSETCWCRCCDFSLDKVDNVAKFMTAMEYVGVGGFFWGLMRSYVTFLGVACNCFSECC